ncbi:N-acetylgalactosamine kinase [Tiliqua scincoides]|uniref:N-acetylgalactosamine kinase n=1 Tax=Tiliqua scincoides TaxID=71010 RepID=UPI003462E082
MAADVPPTLSIQLVEEPRLLKLKKLFVSKFESAPKFYVRAPGRVNLIGEHIDYCGYAVLPMAIEQDILIAAEPLSTSFIHLANTNPFYSDFSINANTIEIDQTKPLWHNYFLCGFKGIEDHFGLGSPSGMNCLIEGTIPPSSGLSSSSALVCCAALVTLMAKEKTLPKVEMAELCAKSERYIGTEGGGMDQSICFLAEKGTAKLIEFNPLRATDVRLPSGAAFVIANSCVEMNKAATSHFNIRVMECRLATKLLAKSRGLDWKATAKLQDVQVKLKLSLEEMLIVVEDVFHPEPYTTEEIGEYLGISSKELRTQILSQNTQDVTAFKLYQRAKHVYSEAARVLEFKKICEEAPDNAVQLLGDLMNQSHASCKDLYECSCPELDRLVDICRQFGAVGSRLTGAGWGGCTVSMVPENKLERFLANVKEAYYKNNNQRSTLEDNSLFATNPGGGAMGFFEA